MDEKLGISPFSTQSDELDILSFELRKVAVDVGPHSLPDELLCVIFQNAHGSGFIRAKTGSDAAKASRWERHLPVTVSHVCKRWRELAVNMASLWTRIDFGRESYCPGELRSADLVALYLERSNLKPLDICLSLKHGFRSEDDALSRPDQMDVLRAIDLICSNIHRWRFFRVESFGMDDLVEIRKHIESSSAPILKHMWINITRDLYMGRSFTFGGIAPALQCVRLYNRAITQCLPPLANARVLDLVSGNTIPQSQMRDISLLCATSLTALRISLNILNTRNAVMAPIVIDMPSLRRLHLQGPSGLTAGMLLDMINAPGLDCIAFSHLNNDHAYSLSSYFLSQGGKFPILRSVEVFDFCCMVKPLICSLPTVERLAVFSYTFFFPIRLLADVHLWPMLKTLEIIPRHTCMDVLGDVLRNRLHNGSPVLMLRMFLHESDIAPIFDLPNLMVEMFSLVELDARLDCEAEFMTG